jgi:hypothetical protein
MGKAPPAAPRRRQDPVGPDQLGSGRAAGSAPHASRAWTRLSPRAAAGASVVEHGFTALVLGLDSMGEIVPGPAKRGIARESHSTGQPAGHCGWPARGRSAPSTGRRAAAQEPLTSWRRSGSGAPGGVVRRGGTGSDVVDPDGRVLQRPASPTDRFAVVAGGLNSPRLGWLLRFCEGLGSGAFGVPGRRPGRQRRGPPRRPTPRAAPATG